MLMLKHKMAVQTNFQISPNIVSYVPILVVRSPGKAIRFVGVDHTIDLKGLDS